MIAGLIITLLILLMVYIGVTRRTKIQQDTLDQFYKDFIKEKNGNFISFKKSLSESELPVVRMTINGKRYGFLLDSGANWNFIDRSLVESLRKEILLPTVGKGKATSATNTIQTEYIMLPLSYNNMKFEERFSVADMKAQFDESTKGTKIKIHGLIGNDFMQKYRWKLDFVKMAAILP